MSRYGPPPDVDDVVMVRVGTCRRGQPRTPDIDVPADPSLYLQRRQLADLERFGFVTAQNSTRAHRAPRCLTCGRIERECLSVRPGLDDHQFELRVEPAPRPTVQLEVAS